MSTQSWHGKPKVGQMYNFPEFVLMTARLLDIIKYNYLLQTTITSALEITLSLARCFVLKADFGIFGF